MPEQQDVGRFVFIDDAHTFGGTQIALAWTIHALVQTGASVLCLCTAKTRALVEQVAGPTPLLRFEEAHAALPLNLFRFPLRLLPYWRLLRRIRSQGKCVWWLNLPDVEFGLAPLLVLRAMGESTHAYLHGTSRFGFIYRGASWKRRLLSAVRDAVADRFVFQLHSCIVVPSRASQMELQSRITSTQRPWLGYLYPPAGTGATVQPASIPEHGDQSTISLWMIGNVVQGHKNNLAVLKVLEVLQQQGHRTAVTVAGVGPDLSGFQREADRRGLSGQITYLGWIAEPCSLVPKDAVVLITSWYETMSLVAREAMRNGLRVVVSPIPVFHEWVPAPLIAESFAAEAFAEKILHVRRLSAEELAALYRSALAPFSQQQFLENFLAIPSVCRPS